MIGKVMGGLVGFLLRGFLGAILGVMLGHWFDKWTAKHNPPVSRDALQRIQRRFFETVFLLMGHLAKADGRVSETEIALTEKLMEKMGLTTEHRREAIGLFKQGSQSDFDLNACLNTFNEICGRSPNLAQMLLVYLMNLALADGVLDELEARVLRQVAERLGFSAFAFEQLLRMINAQNTFHRDQRGHNQAAARPNELQLAYEALGVDKNISDAELKKAYRKLMSEYHPDKLMGQGLPEDMIRAATERAQEIQAAYDLIKKSRH